MTKEQGATVVVEDLEFTDPTEESQGAYAEVGEDYDDSEPTEAEEMQETTEPAVEVDEPADTEEVEEKKVDEPKSKSDRAFAEMRRTNESLKSENEELRQRIAELEKAEKHSQLIAQAQEMGLTDDEIQQVLNDSDAEEQAAKEREDMQAEIDRLNEQVLNAEVDRLMAQDLKDIQAIDPTIESLDDLPPEFFRYREVMDGVDAYFATQAKNQRTKFEGARELGKVNEAPIQRDYYTSEELDNLSDEEMEANWEKVQRSLKKL